MSENIWDKYAQVLVDYSTDVQKGDLVVIRAESTEAKELVKANKGHEKALKTMLNDYKKSYLSIGLNVLGIVLAYLVAPVAVLIANIVILAAWIIPSRTIESQYR